MIAWNCFGNAILDILRAVLREGLRKDIAEPRAEHNDELLGQGGELLTKSKQNQSALEHLQRYQHYQQVHIHEEAMALALVRVVRRAV